MYVYPYNSTFCNTKPQILITYSNRWLFVAHVNKIKYLLMSIYFFL